MTVQGLPWWDYAARCSSRVFGLFLFCDDRVPKFTPVLGVGNSCASNRLERELGAEPVGQRSGPAAVND